MKAKKVYLDLCKWVDLANAEAGDQRAARFEPALMVAKAAVDMGLAIFPLSTQSYMETGARTRFTSRARLAETMLRLSRAQVMANLRQIVPCEVDQSLQSIFKRPSEPRTCQIFGLSVFEALGQPNWKLEPLLDVTLTPGQAGKIHELLRYSLLAGPPDGAVVPGYDPQAYRGPGYKFADEQRDLSTRLAGLDARTTRDVLTARAVVDILPVIEEALRLAGLRPTALTELGKDGMTTFLRGVPTRWAELEMLCQHFANPQLGWRDNDLVDIVTMAIGLVYCDVVVAEKFWVDMARRAGLDQLYGTVLLTDLVQLPEVLTAAA